MLKFLLAFLLAAGILSAPQLSLAQTSSDDASGVKMQAPDVIPKSSEDASVETDSDKEETKIVKAIEVKGNKTIGISTILAKIKIRVGDQYLQKIISDDVKRLYNTGYFSDVSVDRKDQDGGYKVIFVLTEKPIVEKITFSKTRQFNARVLQNKMKTKEGKFLDNKVIKDDVSTLQEMYAKKGLTSAKVEVETTIDETTNKARIHFVIKEGKRVRIRKVTFIGNKTFKSKKLVKTIKTRKAWFFNAGYLKEELLEEDMERLKSFYEREGFIDATAAYTVTEFVPGKVALEIKIEEGTRYYTGAVVITGNVIATEQEILGVMKEIRVGKVFSRAKLDVDIANIRTLYYDKGYIFSDIRESTSLNPQTGQVEIKLDVTEGGIAYIDKIKIQGNMRTRDVVIRRELRMHPGERFDGAKLRRSKERLKNLGYFEDVSYDVEDTSKPDQKDLVVQVKEAKTGTFSFGGGYSTVDQIVGFVEVEQKNFDFTNWPTFTGGGQNLTLRAEAGSIRNNQLLSFTEPWLFNYPISGGFDLYHSTLQREQDVGYAYDEKRTGGDLRLGKQLTEYISTKLVYRLDNIEISNFADGVSADLLAEEGESIVSDLGYTLTRDTRDNVFNPTQGLLLSGTVDVAGGPLRGDKDFYRFQSSGSYDIPLKFDSVLEFRGRVGFVEAYGDSDRVPIYERFFAGGAKTIRGYNERKVGPIDSVTSDPIGGNSMVVANVEYTVPVIDFLKIAGFFDTGNVWSEASDFASGEFKSGVGFGLRVKTPVGPINLDYGFPLNDEPGEEERSGKFYFSISRGF